MRRAGADEINGGWVDRMTVAHLAAGMLANLYTKGRVGFWGALGIGVGWEVLEWFLKARFPGIFEPYDGQDSAQNMAVDVAAVVAGWWVASKLPAGRWI